MPFEEAERNAMLDSRPTTRYMSLWVGEPGNGGTEVTGTGYARIAVTMGTAASGQRSNTSGPHEFTAGTGGWQSGVNWGALYDALTGGNRVSRKALSASRDMSVEGAKITFAVGDIDEVLPA